MRVAKSSRKNRSYCTPIAPLKPIRPLLPSKRSLSIQHLTCTKLFNFTCLKISPSSQYLTVEEIFNMVVGERSYAKTVTGEDVERAEVIRATNFFFDQEAQVRKTFLANQQRDSSKKSINGFILFRSVHCRRLREWLPNISNGDISKFLALAWKEGPEDLKNKYRLDAELLCKKANHQTTPHSDGQANHSPNGFVLVPEDMELPESHYCETTTQEFPHQVSLDASPDFIQTPASYQSSDSICTELMSNSYSHSHGRTDASITTMDTSRFSVPISAAPDDHWLALCNDVTSNFYPEFFHCETSLFAGSDNHPLCSDATGHSGAYQDGHGTQCMNYQPYFSN